MRRARVCLASVMSLAALSLAACKAPLAKEEISDAAESPQAQAVPAPLVNATTSALPPVTLVPDAGPPATPLREDQPVTDELAEKAAPGVVYTLSMRPLEIAPPPKAPEVSAAGIDAARKKTDSAISVELGAGRMRMTLGAGFLLPRDTELRARVDRTGYVLLSPQASQDETYRVVAPTALRALMDDLRLDALPSQVAEVTQVAPEGPRKLGLRTRQVRAVSRGARAEVLLAKVPDALDAAVLPCRFLSELMGASPQTPLCASDEIPARAEIRWPKGGGLVVEMTAAPKRVEIAPQSLVTPPPSLTFSRAPLPSRDGEVLLDRADLAAMRTQAVDTVGAQVNGASVQGLLVVNATDETRVLWVDGVMVAWVAPGARLTVTGLQNGRYEAELRSFVGDKADASEIVAVPGTLRAGPPDAKTSN